MVPLSICYIYLLLAISRAVTQLSYTTTSQAPSTITCNDVTGCEITCTGDNVCDSTTIDSLSASYLTITASGASVLEGTTINCPSNAECTITAIGYRALASSSINCGTNGVCDITGGDEESLVQTDIDARSSTKLTTTADGGRYTLAARNIYCPRNQATPSCIIRIRSDSSPYWSSSIGGPIMEYVYFYIDSADEIEFRCDANTNWDALFTTDSQYLNAVFLYGANSVLCTIELASYSANDFYGTNMLECIYKEKGTNYNWLSGIQCIPWTTNSPTADPSSPPTNTPTEKPSSQPTAITLNPTNKPTVSPTKSPTDLPTLSPTKRPTETPTSQTLHPSQTPTTGSPTNIPTSSPTVHPSVSPTAITLFPTQSPTDLPTEYPTSLAPSNQPTSLPTAATQTPSNIPTETPVYDHTIDPSKAPTNNPTSNPTKSPTKHPTLNPSKSPTNDPTLNPTLASTDSIVTDTLLPSLSISTAAPNTAEPTESTAFPTLQPSGAPIELLETTQTDSDNQEDKNKNKSKEPSTMQVLTGNFIFWILLGISGVLVCFGIIWLVFLYRHCVNKKQEQIASSIVNIGETGTEITTLDQRGPGFAPSVLPDAAPAAPGEADESYGSRIELPPEIGTMASSSKHERVISESESSDNDNIFLDPGFVPDADNEEYLDICTDCTSCKMGKTFDDAFYCNSCWEKYAKARAKQQVAIQTAGGPSSDEEQQPQENENNDKMRMLNAADLKLDKRDPPISGQLNEDNLNDDLDDSGSDSMYDDGVKTIVGSIPAQEVVANNVHPFEE